jgi:hypothetical protein
VQAARAGRSSQYSISARVDAWYSGASPVQGLRFAGAPLLISVNDRPAINQNACVIPLGPDALPHISSTRIGEIGPMLLALLMAELMTVFTG